jgi:hypothetical protein
MHLKAIFEEFENYDFSLIYQKNVKNDFPIDFYAIFYFFDFLGAWTTISAGILYAVIILYKNTQNLKIWDDEIRLYCKVFKKGMNLHLPMV